VAYARVRRIEVALPGDLSAVERFMRRALEHRSGRTVLPLELEDELRGAFENITDEDGPGS
jgi:hypothetical protein